MCYKRFVKKILSVSMILLALLTIPPICQAATIRGNVMEIHYGAGRAAGAEQVAVTLYRGVLGSSDLQKVETFRTGIDGLYHFENIPGRIHHPCARPQRERAELGTSRLSARERRPMITR
jgi:hypothetical protein